MTMATDAALALRRDTRTIGLVSGAHTFSHFLQFALPPLFPLIRAEQGYSYTELGLLVTVFFIASGVFQTVAGFAVDRYGARPVLFGGFGLLAAATMMYGLFPDYPALLALSAVAGLGNSVFHPAGFSILSASIDESRMGRAFGMHAFGGFIGYGAAPLGMVLLAQSIGWRDAVMLVGVVGLVYLAVLIAGSGNFQDSADSRDSSAKTRDGQSQIGVLLSVPIAMLFLFFTALAMGQIGVQTFSPPAMMEMYGSSLAMANGVVTGFLAGTLGGVLVGGWLADRTERHDVLAGAFMLMIGIVIVIAGLTPMDDVFRIALYALAGAGLGIVFPSRDMLVRRIAPDNASGRVFGFVYSGLDTGAAIIPLIAGWLIDGGRAPTVFWVAGLCFVLCVPILGISARTGRKNPS